MMSPTPAVRRFEPPSTLMHWTRFAPLLSATSRLDCIWIMVRPLSSQILLRRPLRRRLRPWPSSSASWRASFRPSLPPASTARPRWFCSVLMRAMVRRTSRTRLGFSSWLVADWKRRLNCSRFRSPSCCCSWSSVFCLRSSIAGILLFLFGQALAEAGHDFGLDRQLLRGALERGLGERTGDAIELEQDPARLDAGDPEFGAALARTHADF